MRPGRGVVALVESNTTGTGRLFAAAIRERGLRPVLLSTRPDRYPWVAADGVEVAWVDTSDPETVALVCARLDRQASLAGVLTSSEYFVGTAARAAVRLGLPGADPASLEQCRDKRRQHTVLERAGVPVPTAEAVVSVPAAQAAAADIGLPVVCKPADGTGSRGVRLCTDLPAVTSHARRLLSRTPDERGRSTLPWIVVEEHVCGPEFSVETFAGATVGITRKHLGPLPHFVETGHDFPAADAGGVAAAAEAAVAALGLDWGAAHTEVRLGPAGPVVIEVNPRLAGGQIPVVMRHATGVDLVGAVVDRTIGSPTSLAPTGPAPGFASIRFLVVHQRQRFAGIGGQAAAGAVPGVVDVAATARLGGHVGGTGSFLDRVGWVIAAGRHGADAAAAAEAGLAALDLLGEAELGPAERPEPEMPDPEMPEPEMTESLTV